VGLDRVHPTSAKVRIDANPTEPADLLSVLRTTMSETGTSQKAMAITAGVSASVLSEALAGRRSFSMLWLWAQDDHFLARFLEHVQEARDLTPANVRAIQRRRIVELVDLLLRQACA
jgi:hypothetical protein